MDWTGKQYCDDYKLKQFHGETVEEEQRDRSDAWEPFIFTCAAI